MSSSLNLLLNRNDANAVQVITKSATSTFKLSFIDGTNQLKPTHPGCAIGRVIGKVTQQRTLGVIFMQFVEVRYGTNNI